MIEIIVHMVRRAYEASDASQVSAEWPPHPARLFSALVDASDLENPDHRRVLESLERSEPPRIGTSAWSISETARSNYVVSNEIVKESKYGAIPLRVASGSRTWPRVMLSEPEIRFAWDSNLHELDVATLNDICKRIGYFGRSTSPAVVRCEEAEILDASFDWWRPVLGVGVPLRTPSAGYLALLERAYATGMSAHEVPTAEVEYDLHDRQTERALPSLGYDTTFAVKRFAKAIDSRRILELTTLARRAFLRHLGDSLPEAEQPASLCGHPNLGETSWKQVMFIALTNVGHPHADGSIKGLALVLPQDLERVNRAHALRAWRGVTELTLGSRGIAQLIESSTSPVQALQSQRWTRSAKTWTTVTPIVPSRFCTSNAQRVRYVQEVCVEGGLPRPDVEILKTPARGALILRADQTGRHAGTLGKPNFHVALQFSEAVQGPLILGDMSRYGLGLCIPTP